MYNTDIDSNIKILTIKNTFDFKTLSRSKNKFFGKYLIIIYSPTLNKYFFNNLNLNAKNFVRIGITISKKVSKLATKRNKIKRRLKELTKILAIKYCKNHYDYSIIAKSQIIDSDFNDIKKDLEFCLKNLTYNNDIHKI